MKFCVIGLGKFGYQLATKLAENGMEVLAIDKQEQIVYSIRDKVTQSICMNVTDTESMCEIGIDEMDTVIIATGKDFSQIILLTALLKKKLNIKNVISRATNQIHEEILKEIGADKVILPEHLVGINLADKLSSPFNDLFKISKNYSVASIKAPESFINQNLIDLDLTKKYNSICIGRQNGDDVIALESDYIIQINDILLFAGNNDDLENIAKL